MKTVTKYIANDGLEFFDVVACEKHEANCVEAERIMAKLPPIPSGCSFSNGDGFVRHDKDTVLAVRSEFCEFAKRYTDHRWLQETIDGGLSIHASYVGRLLDESAPRSISGYWWRFLCMDDELREWGQPYFAKNPHEAKQVQLN